MCCVYVCVCEEMKGEVKITQYKHTVSILYAHVHTHAVYSMASDIHVRMEMGRGKIVASASLSSNGDATEACTCISGK